MLNSLFKQTVLPISIVFKVIYRRHRWLLFQDCSDAFTSKKAMSVFTCSWHTSKFLLKRCQKHERDIPRLVERGAQGWYSSPVSCHRSPDLLPSLQALNPGRPFKSVRRWGGAWGWQWDLGSQLWNSQGNWLGTWHRASESNVYRTVPWARYCSYNSMSTGSSRKISETLPVWSASLMFQGFQVERNK